MKKLFLLAVVILISIHSFSKTITIKGVEFNIIFDEKPTLPSPYYNIKLLILNDEIYNKSLEVITRELSKYPKVVLQNNIVKDFYIIDDCYNTESAQYINGLSTKTKIALKYKVLKNRYFTDVMHHEIFHSIVNSIDKKTINNMLKYKLDEICDYQDETSEVKCLHLESDFITSYHPNYEETMCEMFSTLMYNTGRYVERKGLPFWLVNRDVKNDNLKNKFDILIDFTTYISNGKMNLNYYINVIN